MTFTKSPDRLCWQAFAEISEFPISNPVVRRQNTPMLSQMPNTVAYRQLKTREDLRWFNDFLSRMSPKCAAAVNCDMLGFGVASIARRIDEKANTVVKMLSRLERNSREFQMARNSLAKRVNQIRSLPVDAMPAQIVHPSEYFSDMLGHLFHDCGFTPSSRDWWRFRLVELQHFQTVKMAGMVECLSPDHSLRSAALAFRTLFPKLGLLILCEGIPLIVCRCDGHFDPKQQDVISLPKHWDGHAHKCPSPFISFVTDGEDPCALVHLLDCENPRQLHRLMLSFGVANAIIQQKRFR